jgi:hypothetical protein
VRSARRHSKGDRRVVAGGVLDSTGFSIALAIDAIALTIAHLVAIDRVLDAIASALAIDAIALTIAHLVAIDRVLDAIASALESTAKTGQVRRSAAPAQKRWPWLAL